MADTETLPGRRAEPGQVFTYHDALGVAHDLVADAAGIVRPASIDDAAIADSFGLPVVEDAPAPAVRPPTRAELRARAEELGLAVGARATNAQLAEAIAAAEAASIPTDSAPGDPAQED